MAKPVSYMGLPLKNPVIAAAGPWACGPCGDPARDRCRRGRGRDGDDHARGQRGHLSAHLCARRRDAQYDPVQRASAGGVGAGACPHRQAGQLRHLQHPRQHALGAVVHCSACGALGRGRSGAVPVTPIGAKLESARTDPQEIYEMLRRVAGAVDIPISIRLPAHLACTRAFVRAVERAGARAICTSETLQALWGVDLERRASRVPTFGGYSGPHLLPVTQATVAMLSQLTGCEISAMGGITGAEAALECMMLGASTVQIGSAILLRGYEVIGEVAAGTDAWMRGHACPITGRSWARRCRRCPPLRSCTRCRWPRACGRGATRRRCPPARGRTAGAHACAARSARDGGGRGALQRLRPVRLAAPGAV